MEKHISDTRAREVLRSNLEELGSLQTLTNKLLRLAHIHDVTALEDTEEVSLKDALSTAQKKVFPLAKKKKIVITSSIQDAVVIGDSGSLSEVFVILLENAVKYSPEETGIALKTELQQQTIKISIIDRGIGIKKADLAHIFERFYRAEKSHTQGGFGLGLSIAKKTVEIHNGSIQVSSIVGKGTTFTVVLPRKSI